MLAPSTLFKSNLSPPPSLPSPSPLSLSSYLRLLHFYSQLASTLMEGSSIPLTARAGLEEAEPTPSPLLQLSSNPLAATAVGAIVALASPRLSTNGAEEDIPIHILVFSIIGIFCFCTSRAAPTFLSNHPAIARCYELIGILSVGFFLSSLVSIAVLPHHTWVAYTSGLLAMLPLLHKPGQLLYHWFSRSLVSIYQLLMRSFFPAKETEFDIV